MGKFQGVNEIIQEALRTLPAHSKCLVNVLCNDDDKEEEINLNLIKIK